MAKLNYSRKNISIASLAALAVVGGAYLILKTFPHLTESQEPKKTINFEELSEDELKSWLSERKVSVPEDSTKESLVSLAKSLWNKMDNVKLINMMNILVYSM